jgi:hypothetical protein
MWRVSELTILRKVSSYVSFISRLIAKFRAKFRFQDGYH